MKNSPIIFWLSLILILLFSIVGIIVYGKTLIQEVNKPSKKQVSREFVVPDKEFMIQIKVYGGAKACTTFREKTNEYVEKVIVICDKRER